MPDSKSAPAVSQVAAGASRAASESRPKKLLNILGSRKNTKVVILWAFA